MSVSIKEKSILVTGGTGSFGNFIVHRLLELGAREVRVLSRDEKKQHDMKCFYRGHTNLTFVIGDLRDRQTVAEAMQGIQVVFQAAALKQVPSCESFPMEAVQTNVLGVHNLIAAALERGVEVFIGLSTDKAVKPVNVMGMTKALQERLVLAANSSRTNKGTRLACVRYGNVLRSRGSVIPFFRRQLSLGQRVTVTDERMTRFLLTLNEAIDLVLYAIAHAQGGEIFVRKAPAARILDVASVISEEFGRSLNYEVIGMLPGEKLNEVLVSEEELARVEDCGNYLKVHPWWSKERPHELDREFNSLDHLVSRDEVRKLIAQADAEFKKMELVGGEFAKF